METEPKLVIAHRESPKNKKHKVMEQTNHVGKLTLKRKPKILKYNSSQDRGKKRGNLKKKILNANEKPEKKQALKNKLKLNEGKYEGVLNWELNITIFSSKSKKISFLHCFQKTILTKKGNNNNSKK